MREQSGAAFAGMKLAVIFDSRTLTCCLTRQNLKKQDKEWVAMLSKIVTREEALKHVVDGMCLMYGGFDGMGSPTELADGILQKGVRDLTLIGMDAGYPERGIGSLITHQRVRRLLTTHIGSNPEAGRQLLAGKLDVVFYSQGILAEKVRLGGVGLPGFLVSQKTGSAADGNQQIVAYEGKEFWIESALTADVGIIAAKQADPYGNLVYERSARNLNPLVAMAADLTIAEVEEIVPLGELDPELIVTPGIFVTYIVKTGGGNDA